MNFLNILLQAPASANSGLMQIGMIVLMVVIFYFFIIRPQSKKQKDVQKAREASRSVIRSSLPGVFMVQSVNLTVRQ